MRILFDTNIYFSALLYPDSKPARAIQAASKNYTLILADYNIVELRRIAQKKCPDRLPDIDVFLAKLTYSQVTAPLAPQKLIPDPKDAPILNAAILSEVDIIVSGDHHFLQLDLEYPQVMTPSAFLDYIEQ